MLRAGYTPTRWSADGIDIMLAGESWVCNGAGCFENPEKALGCALRPELHSVEIWKNIYVGRRYLGVSSLGRIRDENGNEIPIYEEKGKYLCVGIASAPDNKTGLRRYYVHQLVVKAFYPGEAFSDEMTVHHLNGNRYDNRAANLIVLSKRAHALIHDEKNGTAGNNDSETDELSMSPRSEFHFAIKNPGKEWREVPSYHNLYWINRQGLIISCDHRAILGYYEPGRRFVNLKNELGTISKYAVDYLVASVWTDSKPSHCDFLVEGSGHLAHKNGDLSDNNLDNLQWVRHVSQLEDGSNHGSRYSISASEEEGIEAGIRAE